MVDVKQSTLEMLRFFSLFYKHFCNKFILGTNNVPLLAVRIQTIRISIEIVSFESKDPNKCGVFFSYNLQHW